MRAATFSGRLSDVAVALALWVGAVAFVVATNDMGFVRDEAFYFAHAETYQDWFVRVEKGGESRSKALERDEILDTWRNNPEHPPLNKMLFGWSWRAFGRKLRPAEGLREKDGRVEVSLAQLGPSHGFAEGARVRLLRPQVVGSSSDVDPRLLIGGEVISRQPARAVVRLDKGADLTRLQAVCPDAGPGPDGVIRRTGCEAVESRTLYFLSESDAMRFPGAVFAGLIVAILYLAGRLFFSDRYTIGPKGRLARPFALLAAVGYLCLPRPFYHAHLAVFDTTITALLLLTTFAWHRSLRSKPWIWITAVLWGLSLLAKHNAFFLPVPFVVHWLWNGWRERQIRVVAPLSGWKSWATLAAAGALAVLAAVLVHPAAGLALGLWALASRKREVELPPVPMAFFAMLPIGFAMLVAFWPLLWVDPLENLARWIEFHLHHEHYMQAYFGKVEALPPFPVEFPWAMTLFSWPLTLLALFLVGLVVVYLPRRLPVWWPRRLRLMAATNGWAVSTGFAAGDLDDRGRSAEQRSLDRLTLLSALWPMALISMPGTPIFGGIKHWMLAYPFMLLIAARGAQAIWCGLVRWAGMVPTADESRSPAEAFELQSTSQVAGSWLRRWTSRAAITVLAWCIAAVALAPAARATADIHPHGTAYYNELLGGVPGATEYGMQRQFWGGATRDGLEEVNRRAPARSSIYFHKSAWGAFVMYQREGWFRRDLHYGGDPAGTALGFYHHQWDHDDYELDLMADYGTRAPVWQRDHQGVPLLSVYERPGTRHPSPPPAPRPAAALPAVPRPPVATVK